MGHPPERAWDQTGSDIILEPQKRAVRILLECFLVFHMCYVHFPQQMLAFLKMEKTTGSRYETSLTSFIEH